MAQTSKKINFNDPQPTGMQDAGIVRGVHFNPVVNDIAELYSQRIAGAIVATSTSTTTDFGSLQVGDRVVVIPATAGNTVFLTVATAGTLPVAAVVGSLYLVIRANG